MPPTSNPPAVPEATEENLIKALQQKMATNEQDDLKMTPEEADKFVKAFKEPEFRRLMSEYVSEISDPANRAEQDAYIRQLEGAGDVPADKEIIRPTPRYVVKLKHVKVAIRDAAVAANKPIPEKEKMFVNIVCSDKIAPPEREEGTMVNGKKGVSWKIPHSLGPVRMEADKGNSLVPTLDCCFHPTAVDFSLTIPGYRDLIVETVRETCVRGFKQVKNDVEIDQEYHVLKGVIYKNGDPTVMIISKTAKAGAESAKSTSPAATAAAAAAAAASSSSSSSSSAPVPPKPPTTSRQEPHTPALQPGFMIAKKTTLKKTGQDGKNGGGGFRGGELLPTGETVPKYTISEQGSFDISEVTMGDAEKALSTRPKAIVYKIELPGVVKVADLDLDVSDAKLNLRSSDSPDRVTFLLEAFLPYPCDGNGSKAKWDKEKKTLTITIPVRAPNKLELEEMQRARLLTVVKSEDTKEVEKAPHGTAGGEKEQEREGEVVDEVEEKMTKLAVKSTTPTPAKAHTSTREAFATDAKIPIDNKAAEFYTLDGVEGNDDKKKGDEEKPAAPAPPTFITVGDFYACSKFEGSKPGFVFKTGKDGLGYYRDAKAGGVAASKPAEKPVEKPAEKIPVPFAPLAPKAGGGTKDSKQQFYPNDPFDFRQSPKTVSILVHVGNVDVESVKADFKPSSLRIEFSDNDGKPHEFCLDLAHEVVPSECKFDVSTKNVVIVLMKKDVDMAWITLEKVAGNMTASGAGVSAGVGAVTVKEAGEVSKKDAGSKAEKEGMGSGSTTAYSPVSEASSKLMFSLD